MRKYSEASIESARSFIEQGDKFLEKLRGKEAFCLGTDDVIQVLIAKVWYERARLEMEIT